LRLPDEPDRMEDIVVSSEETVSTSQGLNGLELYTVGSDLLEYSHEILVQDSHEILVQDPHEILVQESVTIENDSAFSKEELVLGNGQQVQKILSYAEKFRGRPPKFEASEVDSSGQAWYTCTVCNVKCTGRSELLHHMRTHDKDKPFFCKVCGSNFKQVVHLRAHMRMHTGEKPFACTVCSKHFRQKAILDQHMRTHTQDKPYKCTEDGCSRGFTQKTSLKNHLRSHKTGKLSENYRKKEPPPQPPPLAVELTPQTSSMGRADDSSNKPVIQGIQVVNKPEIPVPTKRPVRIIDHRKSPQNKSGKFKTTIVKMTASQFQDYISKKYPNIYLQQPQTSDQNAKEAVEATETDGCQSPAVIDLSKANSYQSFIDSPSCHSLSVIDSSKAIICEPLSAINRSDAANADCSSYANFKDFSEKKPSKNSRQAAVSCQLQCTAFGEMTDSVSCPQEKIDPVKKPNQVAEPFLNFVNLHKPGLETERPSWNLVQLLEELAARWNRMEPEQKNKFSDQESNPGISVFKQPQAQFKLQQVSDSTAIKSTPIGTGSEPIKNGPLKDDSIIGTVFHKPATANQVVLQQFPHEDGNVYEIAMEGVSLEGAGHHTTDIVVISPVRKLKTYPSPKRHLKRSLQTNGTNPKTICYDKNIPIFNGPTSIIGPTLIAAPVIRPTTQLVTELSRANLRSISVTRPSHKSNLCEMSTSLPVLNEPTELTNATDIIEGATDLLEGPTDLGERADISNDENLNEMATEEELVESNVSFVIDDSGEMLVLEHQSKQGLQGDQGLPGDPGLEGDQSLLSGENYEDENIENLYSIYQL